MPSQSPGMYIVLSGIVAAVISGIFSLWTNSVNDKSQLEREEKQRTWQLEREEKQHILQEESEQKKWYREKVYDSYKTSFQVLIKIQQEELDSVSKTNDIVKKYTHITNINKLILEFNIEFTMIIANHQDKDSEEFINKLSTIDKCLRAATIDKSLEEDSSKVRLIMIEIMENDSRIKI
ncbi:MAG: hypothetical protein JGK03_15570 [Microcoleus sp. PH2017_25_DOB_D_A]|uniref:hypothetical protein n=1 Tax=unclassified Microcoleus TaxID=2642155 RepID=UPI001D7BB0B1|nr:MULTISPECIES: hypothetical protein [unclassified Microcoleus]MCC3535591.1 hypothetical protein [Microcoleus sp. PH2017_25_DOB_D_A]MCC3545440.1 hypothetical protein [Microcoleus sp. PH2017_24_DOB_U_A]